MANDGAGDIGERIDALPMPIEIAEYFANRYRNRSDLSRPNARDYAAAGLMKFWQLREQSFLNYALLPQEESVPVQDEAPVVPSESPEEGGDAGQARPVDADAKREEQGSNRLVIDPSPEVRDQKGTDPDPHTDHVRGMDE